MTAPADRIPLAQLPRELRAAGLPAVTYRRAHGAVVDGRIPAERDGGRWFVARGQLAAVAEALAPRVAA